MKVYVCYKYDYDYFDIKEIFTDELQAVIYAEKHQLSIEEKEVKENMFDIEKYTFFNYYSITYQTFAKEPIVHIFEHKGVERLNKTEFIKSIKIDKYDKYINDICYIRADSKEEAIDKFYDMYKIAIDNYYKENNITCQNGKIKEWKRKK